MLQILPKTQMLHRAHSCGGAWLVGVESKVLEESRVGGRGYKLRMSPLHGEFEQLLLAYSEGKGIDMNFKGGDTRSHTYTHSWCRRITESGQVGVARESAVQTRMRINFFTRSSTCNVMRPMWAVSWPTSAHKTQTRTLTPFFV